VFLLDSLLAVSRLAITFSRSLTNRSKMGMKTEFDSHDELEEGGRSVESVRRDGASDSNEWDERD
jgi:hypothetical protein